MVETTNNHRRRASLKDVAAMANTSIATASRVLNNTGYIAEDTRARVLQAAEALNYQPNLRAKGLRQRASHTIGLLIPNLLNAYYTALADAISLLLTAKGYQLLLSSTRDDPEIEQDTLRKLTGHDVDGLLWVPTSGDARLLEFLQSQRIPAISLIRKVEGDQLDSIVFEDFAGSQAATQHLIRLGHRRIGYIGGDIRYSSNNDRWQGFQATMHDAGLPIADSLVKIGTLRDSWGSLATSELLGLTEPPTAIFVSSNAVMPGVMKTLRQTNVCIPEMISLICFDDLDWFSYSHPPISAVSTSHTRIAEAAVDLLFRRIDEPPDREHTSLTIQISFELVIRDSTVPARGRPGAID